MEQIFGLIQVQPSVVFAGDGTGGLAVLTALNPFLSLFLFVVDLHSRSVRVWGRIQALWDA